MFTKLKFFILSILLFPTLLLSAPYTDDTPAVKKSFKEDYEISCQLIKDMNKRIYEVGIQRKQLAFFKKQLAILKKINTNYLLEFKEKSKYWNSRLSKFELKLSDSKAIDFQEGLKLYAERQNHLKKLRKDISKIEDIIKNIDNIIYMISNKRIQISDKILFSIQSKFYKKETWISGYKAIRKNFYLSFRDIFSTNFLNRGHLWLWSIILIIYLLLLKWIVKILDNFIYKLLLLNRKVKLKPFYAIARILFIGYLPAHLIYLIVINLLTENSSSKSIDELAIIFTYACSLSFVIILYLSISTLITNYKNKFYKHLNISFFCFITFVVLSANNINAFDFSTQLYPYIGLNGVALINLITTACLSIWGIICLNKLKNLLSTKSQLTFFQVTGIFILQIILIFSPIIIFIGYSNLIIAFLINCLQTAIIMYFTYLLYKVILELLIIIVSRFNYWFWIHRQKHNDEKEKKLVPQLHSNIIYWITFFMNVIFILSTIILILLAWGMPPLYIIHFFKYVMFTPFPIANNSTLSLYNIVHALIVFIVCLIVSIVISDILYDEVIKFTSIAKATKFALKKIIKYSGITISIATFIYALGVDSKSLTFIISGLSIGVGFALKDTLSNFFAGIIVLLGRQIRVGDWIYSPDKTIEGIVEDIGLHSTKVLGFDKRPYIIPNSLINTKAYVNATFMSNRRIKQYFGVRYQDIGVVEIIIDSIRKMLLEHPDIDKNLPIVVNLIGGDTKRGSNVEGCFGDYSVNLRIYCYTKTTHWIEFHKIQDKTMLKIAEIIQKHGAEIAFPTSDIYLHNKKN